MSDSTGQLIAGSVLALALAVAMVGLAGNGRYQGASSDLRLDTRTGSLAKRFETSPHPLADSEIFTLEELKNAEKERKERLERIRSRRDLWVEVTREGGR